jgi:putative secretion ATPase (PEP-CTERM system associated)
MFEERFGFSGSPFRLAPDPKFFFGSKTHNKAMAYLHYGLRQAEGFIVITGEIGAGKSMLIGHLLDQLDRSNIVAANLLTPNLTPGDLLSHILSAFRIEPAAGGKAAEIEAFEDFLFDQLNHGKRVLLVVDEAQNLPLKTLEELRVLSNMEYDGTPLFQVFLVGQPDFRDTMARPDMEQLRQRVIATYHLQPMARDETEKYILHRLSCVGWEGQPVFASDSFDVIHAATGGLPRKIHKLCNRVLLLAAVEDKSSIDADAVRTVLKELIAEQTTSGQAAEFEQADRVAAPAPLYPNGHSEPPPPIATPRADEDGPPPVAFSAHATGKAKFVEAMRLDPSSERSLRTMNVRPSDKAIASEMERRRRMEAAPTNGNGGESVLDRLKAARKAGKAALKAPAEELAPPPRAATLDEVAVAIHAARTTQRDSELKIIEERAAKCDADAPPVVAAPEADYADAIEPPPLADPRAGWKTVVTEHISETQSELRRAHQSVARLRKQITEVDSRRRSRRERIVESLDRAESLLAEIRNAWR